MNIESFNRKYKAIAEIIQTAANFAVVFGIVFAIAQISQTNRIEKIRLAVEATAPIHTPGFLGSYTRLLDAYGQNTEMQSTDSLREDASYVMNVYDNIAILYNYKLADREILAAGVYGAMSRVEPILSAMKYSPEARANYDVALKLMSANNSKPKERP